MTSPLYEKILQLQAVDIKIRQLRHRQANHQLQDKLAEVTKTAVAQKAVVDDATSAVEANGGQQRSIQHRVAELETKREASQKKLYSGSVTAANELLALEEEVRGFQLRQDEFEEELLVLMELAEGLTSHQAASAEQLKVIEQDVASNESLLAEALEELSNELEQCEAERKDLAEEADPELLLRYEELVPLYDGVTVAQLVNGACDGCHIQLSVVALDQIGRLDTSAVITCEECGRLLVR